MVSQRVRRPSQLPIQGSPAPSRNDRRSAEHVKTVSMSCGRDYNRLDMKKTKPRPLRGSGLRETLYIGRLRSSLSWRDELRLLKFGRRRKWGAPLLVVARPLCLAQETRQRTQLNIPRANVIPFKRSHLLMADSAIGWITDAAIFIVQRKQIRRVARDLFLCRAMNSLAFVDTAGVTLWIRQKR